MDINFENLEKIDEILNRLILIEQKVKSEKRWLTVKELSLYIGYSEDRIHKLKNIEFFENLHFYKRSGKLLFDKYEIDNWIIGIQNFVESDSEKVNSILNNILNN
ncbi:DNA-binding protein [Arcobacter sp. YIC-464]|uniref:DNA-binding protein n=1 Tax=Arcobacter sp. YIC-464 TaxID=3376631 RepID=UPI003C276477